MHGLVTFLLLVLGSATPNFAGQEQKDEQLVFGMGHILVLLTRVFLRVNR